MINVGFVSRLTLVLFLGAFGVMTSTIHGAQTTKDPKGSKEVSTLFDEIKSEAVQLRHDAEELKKYTHSNLSWETHAEKIEQIKQHVNNTGKSLGKLDRARANAAPWQQQAIDRITPLLKELASNVEGTIEHLDQQPKLSHTSPYVDYVDANFEVASTLSELISDYVEYGRSKANSTELAEKLEVQPIK